MWTQEEAQSNRCLLPRAAPTAGPAQLSSAQVLSARGSSRQNTAPKRKKPELHLPCNTPSCCSEKGFVPGEGRAEWTAPGDVCEGDPARGMSAGRSRRLLMSAHRELLWALGAGSQRIIHCFQRNSHFCQKAGQQHSRLEKWGDEWLQDIFVLPEVKKAHYLSDSVWHSKNALKSPRGDSVLPHLTTKHQHCF